MKGEGAREPKCEGPAEWFDLSVVADPLVRDALGALLVEWRMRKRWGDLPSAHLGVHRAILRSYIATRRPPRRADLAGAACGDAGAALDDLAARDLVLVEKGEVVGAYPFTSRPARHRLVIGGQEIGAMCAVDALGAGAMARRDAQVRADCAQCGAPIRISTGERGLGIDRVEPGATVIWAGVEPVSGCAADTQCRSVLMFCNAEHLEAWRAAHAPGGPGYHLTPVQALELGAAIFRPFLPEPEGESAP